MATQIYVNLLDDDMDLDRCRVDQPDIRIYLPRTEEKYTNNQRHLTLQCENNNYQHSTNRQNPTRKPKERLCHQEDDNRPHKQSQDSSSHYDVYTRSENDIYIKYQDFCGDLNSTGEKDRFRVIANQDRNNNSKILKVIIENIRTLPPSGRMELLLELPSSFQESTQNKKASHEMYVHSNTPVQNNSNSPSHRYRKKKCTCRNLAGSLFENMSGSNHLGVPEMRPRSNSDSKLQFRRQRPAEKEPIFTQLSAPIGVIDGPDRRKIDIPLPEINVQDFSERRKYLQTRLENESEELKKDLIDNADFISQVNHFRKMSNTCPNQTLQKSPSQMKSPDDDRKDREKVKTVLKALSLQQPSLEPHHLTKMIDTKEHGQQQIWAIICDLLSLA